MVKSILDVESITGDSHAPFYVVHINVHSQPIITRIGKIEHQNVVALDFSEAWQPEGLHLAAFKKAGVFEETGTQNQFVHQDVVSGLYSRHHGRSRYLEGRKDKHPQNDGQQHGTQ
jgi:hypothetical protein